MTSLTRTLKTVLPLSVLTLAIESAWACDAGYVVCLPEEGDQTQIGSTSTVVLRQSTYWADIHGDGAQGVVKLKEPYLFGPSDPSEYTYREHNDGALNLRAEGNIRATSLSAMDVWVEPFEAVVFKRIFDMPINIEFSDIKLSRENWGTPVKGLSVYHTSNLTQGTVSTTSTFNKKVAVNIKDKTDEASDVGIKTEGNDHGETVFKQGVNIQLTKEGGKQGEMTGLLVDGDKVTLEGTLEGEESSISVEGSHQDVVGYGVLLQHNAELHLKNKTTTITARNKAEVGDLRKGTDMDSMRGIYVRRDDPLSTDSTTDDTTATLAHLTSDSSSELEITVQSKSPKTLNNRRETMPPDQVTQRGMDLASNVELDLQGKTTIYGTSGEDTVFAGIYIDNDSVEKTVRGTINDLEIRNTGEDNRGLLYNAMGIQARGGRALNGDVPPPTIVNLTVNNFTADLKAQGKAYAVYAEYLSEGSQFNFTGTTNIRVFSESVRDSSMIEAGGKLSMSIDNLTGTSNNNGISLGGVDGDVTVKKGNLTIDAVYVSMGISARDVKSLTIGDERASFTSTQSAQNNTEGLMATDVQQLKVTNATFTLATRVNEETKPISGDVAGLEVRSTRENTVANVTNTVWELTGKKAVRGLSMVSDGGESEEERGVQAHYLNTTVHAEVTDSTYSNAEVKGILLELQRNGGQVTADFKGSTELTVTGPGKVYGIEHENNRYGESFDGHLESHFEDLNLTITATGNDANGKYEGVHIAMGDMTVTGNLILTNNSAKAVASSITRGSLTYAPAAGATEGAKGKSVYVQGKSRFGENGIVNLKLLHNNTARVLLNKYIDLDGSVQSTAQGTVNVTLANGSHWKAYGDNNAVTTLALNGGHVSLQDEQDEADTVPTPANTMLRARRLFMSSAVEPTYTVMETESLTGGGDFTIDINPATGESDMIRVTGSSEGTYQLTTVNHASETPNFAPIKVVESVGEGNFGAIFKAKNKLEVGEYVYSLGRSSEVKNAKSVKGDNTNANQHLVDTNDNNWYYYVSGPEKGKDDDKKDDDQNKPDTTPPDSHNTDSLTSTAKAFMSTHALHYLAAVRDDVLRQRVGSIHTVHAVQDGTTPWAQMIGHGFEGTPDGGARLEVKTAGVRAGVDSWVTDATLVGGFVTITRLEGDGVAMPKTDLSGQNYEFGLYGTHVFDNRTYVDVVGRVGHTKSKFTTSDTLGLGVKGRYIRTNYGSLSVEAGRTFALTDRLAWGPMAKVKVTRLSGENARADNGLSVRMGGMTSLTGRVGLTLEGTVGTTAPVRLAGHVAYEREFTGKTDLTYNHGRPHEVDYRSGAVLLGASIDGRWGKKHTWMVDVERSLGADINTAWQINAGVRLNF